MRTRLTLISLLAAAALAFGASAGSAKTTKPKGKKVTCTAQVTNQSSNATTGYDLGFIQCSKPYGKGLIYETYKEGVATGHVTSSGKVTSYLPLGTVSGTYSVSGTLTPGTDTFTGTTKVTGGSGKYKGAKGSGKITCTTTDLGAHLKCTTVVTVKRA